jgi:arylformamidase
VFHDITLDFTPEMLIFPGDPQLEIMEHMLKSKGDVVNLSILTFGSHTGTHIDAPKHFVDSGKTVDQLALDHFIGTAKVFEIPEVLAITVKDLKPLNILKDDIVLLKTLNSPWLHEDKFHTDFAYLTPEAAKYLAEIGIKTLGFDYLSIDKYNSNDFGAHYALLGQGIVIIEGLVLRDIRPGQYQMVALPIKIKGGNGSPVRAVLIEEI